VTLIEQPLCSISIDVDAIGCYYRIHGLGEPPPQLAEVVMRQCVPRFAALLEEAGVKATFFVVAADVDIATAAPGSRAARAAVRRLAARGHEIASHSYSHPYELARLGRPRVAEEIDRAHGVLGDIAGEAPRGFRAPGYDVSATILEHLIARGYLYDSSVLASPPYYLAKAAVMAGMRLVGRTSGAVMTHPGALAAPADPYRPSVRAPFRRGEAPLLELPVAVTPWTRMPAIGTALILAPPWLRRRFIASMRRRPLFNFELHGIDLADAETDGIPGALVSRQPDLRVPVARKRRALAEAIAEIGARFRFVTLREAADELAAAV
jgi:peptidoglycan/xylan/chitin deacetylase (PgdA/CDA1 family)